MAMLATENSGSADGEHPTPGFGGTIFLQQAAHVTVLDGHGRIMTVNDAWERFGRENGLDPAYRFVGADYPELCRRAIDAPQGGEGARDALDGLTRLLAGEHDRFSLVYPCHAPHQQRWFLMYARPIGPQTDGAVVSHVDVTALHVAGLVPDETAAAPPRVDPPPSAPRAADGLARLLFPDDGHRPFVLARTGPRLR